MLVCQNPLTEIQILQLQKHGRLVGNRRYVLEQYVFPEEIPYFTWLVIEGCRASYKHELLRQLKSYGRLPNQVVENVISSSTFKLSTKRFNLKCALVSPQEFGLAADCKLAELIDAGSARNLELLPADAALFAALQFADQWTTDRLVVFISNPTTYKGQNFLFALENRQVNVVGTEHEQKCHPGHSYLFARKN